MQILLNIILVLILYVMKRLVSLSHRKLHLYCPEKDCFDFCERLKQF